MTDLKNRRGACVLVIAEDRYPSTNCAKFTHSWAEHVTRQVSDVSRARAMGVQDGPQALNRAAVRPRL